MLFFPPRLIGGIDFSFHPVRLAPATPQEGNFSKAFYLVTNAPARGGFFNG